MTDDGSKRDAPRWDDTSSGTYVFVKKSSSSKSERADSEGSAAGDVVEVHRVRSPGSFGEVQHRVAAIELKQRDLLRKVRDERVHTSDLMQSLVKTLEKTNDRLLELVTELRMQRIQPTDQAADTEDMEISFDQPVEANWSPTSDSGASEITRAVIRTKLVGLLDRLETIDPDEIVGELDILGREVRAEDPTAGND